MNTTTDIEHSFKAIAGLLAPWMTVTGTTLKFRTDDPDLATATATGLVAIEGDVIFVKADHPTGGALRCAVNGSNPAADSIIYAAVTAWIAGL